MGTIIKEKGWYALKHTPRVISDRIFGMQIYTWLIKGAGGGGGMWKTGFDCLIGIQISTHTLSGFVFFNTRNRRE